MEKKQLTTCPEGKYITPLCDTIELGTGSSVLNDSSLPILRESEEEEDW